MKSAITVAAIAIATIVNRSGWVASRNVDGLDPVASLAALTAMRRIVAADSGPPAVKAGISRLVDCRTAGGGVIFLTPWGWWCKWEARQAMLIPFFSLADAGSSPRPVHQTIPATI